MVTSTIGVVCLAVGLQGWFITKTNIIQRLGLIITAFLMIDPTLLTDIIGLLLLVGIIVWQKYFTMKIEEKNSEVVRVQTSKITG
jgi:TRAP-type uncharacterized transport system fused permease subunit